MKNKDKGKWDISIPVMTPGYDISCTLKRKEEDDSPYASFLRELELLADNKEYHMEHEIEIVINKEDSNIEIGEKINRAVKLAKNLKDNLGERKFIIRFIEEEDQEDE